MEHVNARGIMQEFAPQIFYSLGLVLAGTGPEENHEEKRQCQ
jgi:hypothetical protein